MLESRCGNRTSFLDSKHGVNDGRETPPTAALIHFGMAKGNTDLDDRERRAADAMLAVCGPAWKVVPKDVKGAPAGTYDFDLTDDSTTIAVEVSTIADHLTIRDTSAWSNYFPSNAVNVVGLRRGWVVMVAARGNARRTHEQLETWLADLESRGEHSVRTERWQEHVFTPEANRPPWFATLHEMASVGIISADVEPTLSAGECRLLIADNGFTWNSSEDEYVSDFVTEQLAGLHESDVQKLARAPGDRRVLFLWLDAQSHFDVVRRMDNNLLGGTLADTGNLDEVWIGRYFIDGSVKVYRWRGVDGWRFNPTKAAGASGP